MSRPSAIPLRCPMCPPGDDGLSPMLTPRVILAHGPSIPEQHEQIKGVSYDYVCKVCHYRENHRPQRRDT